MEWQRNLAALKRRPRTTGGGFTAYRIGHAAPQTRHKTGTGKRWIRVPRTSKLGDASVSLSRQGLLVFFCYIACVAKV